MSDNDGRLWTANYPGLYGPNCQWTVILTSTSGYDLEITIDGLGLGTGDWLEVRKRLPRGMNIAYEPVTRIKLTYP